MISLGSGAKEDQKVLLSDSLASLLAPPSGAPVSAQIDTKPCPITSISKPPSITQQRKVRKHHSQSSIWRLQ